MEASRSPLRPRVSIGKKGRAAGRMVRFSARLLQGRPAGVEVDIELRVALAPEAESDVDRSPRARGGHQGGQRRMLSQNAKSQLAGQGDISAKVLWGVRTRDRSQKHERQERNHKYNKKNTGDSFDRPLRPLEVRVQLIQLLLQLLLEADFLGLIEPAAYELL